MVSIGRTVLGCSRDNDIFDTLEGIFKAALNSSLAPLSRWKTCQEESLPSVNFISETFFKEYSYSSCVEMDFINVLYVSASNVLKV
jgi:hypothetical protein